MAQLPTVFISYNPDSEFEQTLAIRLQTIGAVHGYNTLLPDRAYRGTQLTLETKNRILLSDFFVVFSTSQISKVVLDEINVASNHLNDKTRILVIYDKSVGKNLKGLDNCTSVFIDRSQDILQIATSITNSIKNVSKKQNSDILSSLSGILLVGLGLFALSEIFDSPPPRPRKKAAKKKALKRKATKKKATKRKK